MKRAIVTGASRGIGRAVTEMLLAEGWDVVGLARLESPPPFRHERLQWWSNDLGHLSPASDLSEDDAFDVLVHCAGIRGPYGAFLDNDEGAWVQTIVTNLIGTARIIRTVLPALQKSEDGRILLFSGGGAFTPEPGYTAYATTKGATVAFMETLAAEIDGTNVTINCVAPGFVPTTIHAGTPHEHKPFTGQEMAQAVACVRHLLSPEARGLNGRTVSAAWDDFENLTPWTIPHLDTMGRRWRYPIQGLQKLLIRGLRAI